MFVKYFDNLLIRTPSQPHHNSRKHKRTVFAKHESECRALLRELQASDKGVLPHQQGEAGAGQLR